MHHMLRITCCTWNGTIMKVMQAPLALNEASPLWRGGEAERAHAFQ